jgi:hypothetical protein
MYFVGHRQVQSHLMSRCISTTRALPATPKAYLNSNGARSRR